MDSSRNITKIKKMTQEEYNYALSLMQYHTQLLWQQFGVFLLAETVLIGFIGTVLVQHASSSEKSLLPLFGAIFGILLCVPWWTTYDHNYKYYELRLAQARRLEKELGISLLTEGKKLSSGNEIIIDGMTLRHSFCARFLPPRRAIRLLIIMFGIASLGLIPFSWPW